MQNIEIPFKHTFSQKERQKIKLWIAFKNRNNALFSKLNYWNPYNTLIFHVLSLHTKNLNPIEFKYNLWWFQAANNLNSFDKMIINFWLNYFCNIFTLNELTILIICTIIRKTKIFIFQIELCCILEIWKTIINVITAFFIFIFIFIIKITSYRLSSKYVKIILVIWNYFIINKFAFV